MSGHVASWRPDNVFSGTAWYYSRFRPGYDESVIGLLRHIFSLGGGSRVLDLGCGTGQMSLGLSPYVKEVVAVDPQEEMIGEGKAMAAAKGVGNIRWVLGESAKLQNLVLHFGEVDLTVIARAFHWMDRDQTLRDLHRITRRGGGVAVVSDNGPRDGPRDGSDVQWKSVLDDVVRFWLGDVRRAGTEGTYSHPTRHHEDILRESEFASIESHTISSSRRWTTDEIIGYLYSTSSSSIPVLGDKKEPFERDVRQRLGAIDPAGVFREQVTTTILTARKT